MTTIAVSQETKKMLDEFKIHPREPYEEVIIRLAKEAKKKKEKQRK